MQLDDVPIRDALEQLAAKLGVRIIGRFDDDDRLGLGLDANSRIWIDHDDAPALEALEEIIEQCKSDGERTWQLRPGFIEVGTKQRLAVPSAHEMRIYPISDLMIEAPDFPYEGLKPGISLKYEVLREEQRDGGSPRKRSGHVASELFAFIIDCIEPQAWRLDDELGEGADRNPAFELPPGTCAPLPAGQRRQPADGQRFHDLIDEKKQLSIRGKWAAMRLWRDRLIVTAPDFIHRQIGGYGDPPPSEIGPIRHAPKAPVVQGDSRLAAEQNETLAALRNRKVALNVEQLSFRDAVEQLSQELTVPILVRWEKEPGIGLDPDAEVSLPGNRLAPATTLEWLIAQAAGREPCTWQVRRGYIEVGTKERLSVPSARQVRVYHIRDLMLDPPYFRRPEWLTIRETPEQLAAKLFEMIIDVVERIAWVRRPDEPADSPASNVVRKTVGPAKPHAPSQSRPDKSSLHVRGRWATMELWGDQLIVSAPEFIHRQIDG